MNLIEENSLSVSKACRIVGLSRNCLKRTKIEDLKNTICATNKEEKEKLKFLFRQKLSYYREERLKISQIKNIFELEAPKLKKNKTNHVL